MTYIVQQSGYGKDTSVALRKVPAPCVEKRQSGDTQAVSKSAVPVSGQDTLDCAEEADPLQSLYGTRFDKFLKE